MLRPWRGAWAAWVGWITKLWHRGISDKALKRISPHLGKDSTIAVGEILWGIGVDWLMLRLRRWVNDPSIEILLSILTPFIAYWPQEHLGVAGPS